MSDSHGGTLPENLLLEQTKAPAPVEIPETPPNSYRASDIELIDKAYEGK